MGEYVRQVFGSLAVRHGIKFGLAGVLSVFVALSLRLPDPTWALMTAFVIMLAQFVGAVAQKSIMRLAGTAIGGLLGYLLTAGLEQRPLLYLSLVGAIVGLGTALFGYTKYPYAFLLCALTTMVVASNGMADPEFSWKPALARIEEVSVGIIVAVLVTSLVWPRYARKEFLEKMRLALCQLREILSIRSALLFKVNSDADIGLKEGSFATVVAGMQNLLHFGALESQHFRARLLTFTEIISSLNRISGAIETLEQTLPAGAPLRLHLQSVLEAAHEAIADCLGTFADVNAGSSRRASSLAHMNALCGRWREKLRDFRQTDIPGGMPVEHALHFSGHALSLDEISEELGKLNRLLDSLPADPLEPSHEATAFPSPPLDPFWIRNGVKACLAVTLGLFVQNWLHPPGGTMVALATWVFTVLSRLYPGGQGDRRAFHCVVYTATGGIVYVALMLVLAPALSSYLILNLLLFLALFLFGYLTQAIPGVTFSMQIVLLAVVGTLGLNAQQPVNFQRIAGVYFGIVVGLILSALVQRLLWPVLPQWEIRDRILELLRLCKTILQCPPDQRPAWLHQRLAHIPVEVNNWIAVMNKPDCPPDEPPRLREYVQTLRRAAGNLLVSAGQLLPLLPEQHAAKGRDALHGLRDVMMLELEAQSSLFRLGKAPTLPDVSLARALEETHRWVESLRLWILEAHVPVKDSIRILGLADRFAMVGQDLLTASKQAAALRLPLYMGDSIL